jgi:spermidine synthase
MIARRRRILRARAGAATALPGRRARPGRSWAVGFTDPDDMYACDREPTAGDNAHRSAARRNCQLGCPRTPGGVSGSLDRPALDGRPLRGAVASLDNVAMPGHQQGGNGHDGGRPGAHGIVELLGDLGRPHAWMLLVGGVPQSHVDLDDPRHLELEYMRRLGHVIDLAAPAGKPLRVLHLGGGGLTLARYVAATRPGSSQLAVESDAAVARLVWRRLPLDQPGRPRTGTGRIRVRVADARTVVEQVRAGSFDVLVADVFAGARTPGHLTSVEFAAAAARALAPSGTFAANIGDGPPLAHARGRVAAVRSVFRHTCVIAEAAVLRGRRFGNLVVAAADHELPLAALTRLAAADPFPARLVEGAALDRFVARSNPIEDAHAEPSPAPPPDVFARGAGSPAASAAASAAARRDFGAPR